jgi:hypothetical protein
MPVRSYQRRNTMSIRREAAQTVELSESVVEYVGISIAAIRQDVGPLSLAQTTIQLLQNLREEVIVLRIDCNKLS